MKGQKIDMKIIKTVDAEGAVLCHDITQIIKGVTKDTVFKKGHVVRKEDIPALLSVGKDNLYIWENDDNMLHENEAAEILCSLCINDHMNRTGPKEGKINLSADCHGLLKINREALKTVNSFGQMMIASIHSNFPVYKGDKIAGTRIIPLVIEKEKMERVRDQINSMTSGQPIFEIKEFKGKKVGVVTTGNEVFYGRIKDTFTPVIIDKIAEFGGEMFEHIVLEDDDKKVTKAILELIEKGADMVVCTGGMSVDPDDKTPLAIKNTGADIISYGAPVLPGAMFLLAYYGKNGSDKTIPILGLPGCVMYAKRTIFDLILPRVMADDEVTAEDIAELGEGGLCLECDVCVFPKCTFGR